MKPIEILSLVFSAISTQYRVPYKEAQQYNVRPPEIAKNREYVRIGFADQK